MNVPGISAELPGDQNQRLEISPEVAEQVQLLNEQLERLQKQAADPSLPAVAKDFERLNRVLDALRIMSGKVGEPKQAGQPVSSPAAPAAPARAPSQVEVALRHLRPEIQARQQAVAVAHSPQANPAPVAREASEPAPEAKPLTAPAPVQAGSPLSQQPPSPAVAAPAAPPVATAATSVDVRPVPLPVIMTGAGTDQPVPSATPTAPLPPRQVETARAETAAVPTIPAAIAGSPAVGPAPSGPIMGNAPSEPSLAQPRATAAPQAAAPPVASVANTVEVKPVPLPVVLPGMPQNVPSPAPGVPTIGAAAVAPAGQPGTGNGNPTASQQAAHTLPIPVPVEVVKPQMGAGQPNATASAPSAPLTAGPTASPGAPAGLGPSPAPASGGGFDVDAETVKLRANVALAQERVKIVSSPAGRKALQDQVQLQGQLAKVQGAEQYARVSAEQGRMAAMAGEVQSRIDAASKSLGGLGSAAQNAYSQGSSSIFGLVQAADPFSTWPTYEESVKGLAIAVGTDLLPWVDRASAGIQDLTGWYSGLSGETKKTVGTTLAFGVAAAGCVSVILKVASAARAATIAFQSMSLATGGLTAIIGLAGGAAAAWLMLRDNAKGAGDAMNEAGRANVGSGPNAGGARPTQRMTEAEIGALSDPALKAAVRLERDPDRQRELVRTHQRTTALRQARGGLPAAIQAEITAAETGPAPGGQPGPGGLPRAVGQGGDTEARNAAVERILRRHVEEEQRKVQVALESMGMAESIAGRQQQQLRAALAPVAAQEQAAQLNLVRNPPVLRPDPFDRRPPAERQLAAVEQQRQAITAANLTEGRDAARRAGMLEQFDALVTESRARGFIPSVSGMMSGRFATSTDPAARARAAGATAPDLTAVVRGQFQRQISESQSRVEVAQRALGITADGAGGGMARAFKSPVSPAITNMEEYGNKLQIAGLKDDGDLTASNLAAQLRVLAESKELLSRIEQATSEQARRALPQFRY